MQVCLKSLTIISNNVYNETTKIRWGKMKRFISLSIICLMSLFAFAGCGIKGGTLATGIEFVHDVFYVDYEVRTFLDL